MKEAQHGTFQMAETLRALGIDARPHKEINKGGYICLPLDKNLNGNTQAKHPDWTPISCPSCGRKCWKFPEADRIAKEQGAKMLCTECAIDAGLVRPFPAGGFQRSRKQRRKKA